MFGVGVRLGPYELVGELGRGGMATLYVARQTGPGGFSRRVAIKVIHPQVANDLEMVKMFLDEARLGGNIRHPNVVHVENVGEHEGAPYIVMEYIEGFTLAAALQARARESQPIPIDVAVSIIAQVADALHAAHEGTDELGRPLAIVHRDVSPSNVLIDRRGHVKLIDFGVAKARQRLARTMPGLVKGKLAYMAPEQLEAGAIDRRADVFALGVVLWELLTLRRLFFAQNDIETLLRIREGTPPSRPSFDRPELSPQLDDVVLTMLAHSLDERFYTAAAARYALIMACPAALAVEPSAIASLAPAPEQARGPDERTTAARPGTRGP